MIYIDTSALVKLVWDEDGSEGLRTYLERRSDRLISSVLIVVETRRTVLRAEPSRLPRADLVLGRVMQIHLEEPIVASASRLPGAGLRSLDAIHLATALTIKDDLNGLLTYDKRLAEAAAERGIPVVTPA